MGGLCSKVSAVDKSPSDTALGLNQVFDHEPVSLKEEKSSVVSEEAAAKRAEELQQHQQSFSFLESVVPGLAVYNGADAGQTGSRTPRLARTLSQKAGLGKTKVSEVGMILGRASTAGLGKAVDVLDTLGSSMASLNASSGFVSSSARGNKISILAFEVANTIVKGSNLMRSLSKANVKHIKEVVLPSEGVQHLISNDMDELLEIAAADKREELEVFSKEVIRFGNRCKDPQWHNLNRYFEKLASERRTSQHYLKQDAEAVMQQLIICVQYTAELYHELHALDRFEQDYRRKHQDHDGLGSTGDSLHILKQEVKSQNKHVKILKKRSLWSKNLEEVVEKLVDIVHFLDLEIYDAFGYAESEEPQEPVRRHKRLGSAGLALHYANIISQIDTLVSRSSSISPTTRDNLYQGLPPTIKSTLRSRLQSFEIKEELTISQIKAEMEKTLRWLVPIANNTTNWPIFIKDGFYKLSFKVEHPLDVGDKEDDDPRSPPPNDSDDEPRDDAKDKTENDERKGGSGQTEDMITEENSNNSDVSKQKGVSSPDVMQHKMTGVVFSPKVQRQISQAKQELLAMFVENRSAMKNDRLGGAEDGVVVDLNLTEKDVGSSPGSDSCRGRELDVFAAGGSGLTSKSDSGLSCDGASSDFHAETYDSSLAGACASSEACGDGCHVSNSTADSICCSLDLGSGGMGVASEDLRGCDLDIPMECAGGMYMDRLGNTIVPTNFLCGQQSSGGVAATVVEVVENRPSEEEILAFGGMRDTEVRTSRRLREQENAHLPQLERAKELNSRKLYGSPAGYPQGVLLDPLLVMPAPCGPAWTYGCRMYPFADGGAGYLQPGWMASY